MDQGKQQKRVLSVRVSESAYTFLEARASELDVDVSVVVRRMLAYASASMPKHWTPRAK